MRCCTPLDLVSSGMKLLQFGEVMLRPPGQSRGQARTNLFLWQRKTRSRRQEQRSKKPPMSSITSSVEPGEGGQHQPPGPPSHPFAPMSARSPRGATRGGKLMCSHRGIIPQWHLEYQKTMLHPKDSPPWHPPVLSGSRTMPGMVVWLAGRLVGSRTSLGTLGTTGQSRDRDCGTTTVCTGR